MCTTQSCTHNDGIKAATYLVRSQKEQIQGIARLLINTLSEYGLIVLIVLLHHALECRLRTVVCMPSGDGKSTSGEQGNRRAWRTPGRAEHTEKLTSMELWRSEGMARFLERASNTARAIRRRLSQASLISPPSPHFATSAPRNLHSSRN